MRGWARAAAVLAALAFAPGAAATNPVVSLYNDFAQDGVLSCHSRADLRAVLTDATVQQYGDPYTLIGLKLAARKQLAGGCRHSANASPASTAGSQRTGPTPKAGADARKAKKARTTQPTATRSAVPSSQPRAEMEGAASGRMLLVGAGLLLLTLGTGGWAATRAFNGKR